MIETASMTVDWSVRIVLVLLVLAHRAARADPRHSSKHVVVAQEGHAADVGREVLRRGGNAIDASIATAFALAVTLPEAGNLGGGGFIVAYLADRHEVVTVDFREMAPRQPRPTDVPRARREAAAPLSGRGLGGRRARDGPRPGAGSRPLWQDAPGPSWFARPRGWRARVSRSRPTWPARSIASSHAPLPSRTGRIDPARRFRPAGDFPSRSPHSAKPDRTPWKAGDRLIQRDLASTLDRIAGAAPTSSTPAGPPS